MREERSEAGEILVIDDEEPIRRYLARILTLAGYRCETAGSAAEARELLSSRPFALALCDLSLPDLPGLNLVNHINNAYPETAVVICTGTDDPAVARDAVENGAYGYIVKPFEQNEILITVHTSLRRQRLEMDVLRHNADLERQVAARTAELSLVVADLRQTTDELRRRDERFRSLAECTPAVTLLLDEVGECVFANAAARALVGGTGDDLTGEGWHSIVHPDDAATFLAWVDDAVHRPEGASFEVRVINHIGAERWLRARVAPTRGDDQRATGFVLVAEDVTEQRASAAELERLARSDPLTGLANRAVVIEQLNSVLAASPSVQTHAVMFVDLDRFKLVNDSHGHIVGDRVLMAVAKRLHEEVARAGIVSRLGGDEFVILIEDVTSPRLVIRLAERVLAAVRAPMAIEGREFRIGAAVGIAFATSGEGSAEKVLSDADIALHRAKDLGGNGYEIFDESMRRHLAERLHLEARLRRALDREELQLVYQPEFRVDGRLIGFEALLRWDDVELGKVPPSEFIPVAEESGLIGALGRWVLTKAAIQARTWNDRRPPDRQLIMSVNLSARQIRDPLLVEHVAAALDRARLEPQYLCLEITETVIMDDASETIPVLEGLERLGVQLAVDDFGTGYSSLSYLADLPVNYLKIDRSFVEGAGSRAKSESILGAVIQMAHGLGLKVIAEGVETAEQLTWLSARGCDYVQGFMLGRPRDAERCEHWVTAGMPAAVSPAATVSPGPALAALSALPSLAVARPAAASIPVPVPVPVTLAPSLVPPARALGAPDEAAPRQ